MDVWATEVFQTVPALLGLEGEEQWLLEVLLPWVMIGSGLSAAVFLQCLTAPYGRYAAAKENQWWLFGLHLDGRLAWVLQELPALAFALVAWQTSSVNSTSTASKFLLVLFTLHYAHRTLIFPLRIQNGKPTPFFVFLLAATFCLVNGYLQARYLTAYSALSAGEEFSPRFVIGCCLFFLGMYINIDADSILRNLRRGPADKGYYIPRNGMFEYVSGANFFGEIVEWTGFAIAAWSLPALAFAFFTLCNIGPRAMQHHRDYQARFSGEKGKEKYPEDRKALIPFLL